MRKVAVVALGGVSVAIAACSLTSLDGFSGGAPDSALNAALGADAKAGDGGSGSADAAAAPTACSGAGTSVFAVKASDVSPGEGGLVGPACNVDNVLRQDEKLAGLERSNDFNNGTGLLGGKQVTGCVVVEFADLVNLASIVVRMAPTPNARGKACGADACGTGHTAQVFTGDSLAALQHREDVQVLTTSGCTSRRSTVIA